MRLDAEARGFICKDHFGDLLFPGLVTRAEARPGSPKRFHAVAKGVASPRNLGDGVRMEIRSFGAVRQRVDRGVAVHVLPDACPGGFS